MAESDQNPCPMKTPSRTLTKSTVSTACKKSCVKQDNTEDVLVREMKKSLFKATPVNRKVLAANSLVCGVPKVSKAKVTKVREFKFHTEERVKIRTLRKSLVGTLGQMGNGTGGLFTPTISHERVNTGLRSRTSSTTSSSSSLRASNFMAQTKSSALKIMNSTSNHPASNSNAVPVATKSVQAPKIMKRKL